MGVIQSAINSMLGSTSRLAIATRAYHGTMKKIDEVKASDKGNKPKNKIGKFPRTPVTMEQANQHAREKIMQQKTQRRNFMEYLGKQESSLGKVGDLPQSLQKQIAQQYTRSQRRTLMNKMDRESQKNGGNI